MQPFILDIGFTTPVIVGEDGVSLDAIILGELTVRMNDDDAMAHLREILAHTDGVPHASRAFFRSPADDAAEIDSYHAVTKIMNVNREFNQLELPDTDIRGGRGNKIIPSSTAFTDSNPMNSYTSRNIHSASFFAVGDVDRIRLTLSDLTGIGKLRSSGYGQTDRLIEIETDVIGDPRSYGLMGLNGMPVRSVPLSVWIGIGGSSDAKRRQCRGRPPYWDDRTPMELCVVPDHTDISRAKIERVWAMADDAEGLS